jgi:hypothetical protein
MDESRNSDGEPRQAVPDCQNTKSPVLRFAKLPLLFFGPEIFPAAARNPAFLEIIEM